MTLESRVMEKTVTRQLRLAYHLYLPPEFCAKSAHRWPLVFFLHGAGERGDDLELIQKHGLMRRLVGGENFPFILAAPQCPVDWTWDRSLPELDQLLTEILEEYPINCRRIYVTGLSMGGYGTWHWGASNPSAFAALVPICGGAMPLMGFPERIAVLKEVPIWAFHGSADQVVPVQCTRDLVEVLRSVGAPIRFTEYEGVGHHSWELAYNEPELLPWLLQQENPNFQLG